MAKKNEKHQIEQLLRSLFYKEDKISFFFLKKSKVKSSFEYKIPFKTKKKVNLKKINLSQQQMQKETGIPWDFVQWSKFIGKLIPED